MDGDVLLVESDDEGLDATAADMAARRAFAMQHDSLFGLDSQSQHVLSMPSLFQTEHFAKVSCLQTMSCCSVCHVQAGIGPMAYSKGASHQSYRSTKEDCVCLHD